MSIHSLAIPLKKQLLNVFFKKLPSYSICHTPSDYPPKHYLSLVSVLIENGFVLWWEVYGARWFLRVLTRHLLNSKEFM